MPSIQGQLGLPTTALMRVALIVCADEVVVLRDSLVIESKIMRSRGSKSLSTTASNSSPDARVEVCITIRVPLVTTNLLNTIIGAETRLPSPP